MSTAHFFTAVALAGVSLAAPAQSNMKHGLWEVTTKIQSGNAQIEQAMAKMQQQLASMPPEQRKMVEDMMAKNGVAVGANGNSVKACITQEMIARSELPAQQNGSCSTTYSDRSASGVNVAFSCTSPPSTGEGRLSFLGPESYGMKMKVNTQVRGQPTSLTVDGTGKWVSSDCGAIKPLK